MVADYTLIGCVSTFSSKNFPSILSQIARFSISPWTLRRNRAIKNSDKIQKVKVVKRPEFALCQVIPIIHDHEAGNPGTSSKYELHVNLKLTRPDGPPTRNRVILPHRVHNDGSVRKICVICPPGSEHERIARDAGVKWTGEGEIFSMILAKKIPFARCLAHQDSYDKLVQSGAARILGPKGLMPSPKTGSVVTDVASYLADFSHAVEYRETNAILHMPIGLLSLTPVQLKENIRILMAQIKADLAKLEPQFAKRIRDVYISSTNSPGFPLNGLFTTPDCIPPEKLIFPKPTQASRKGINAAA